MVFISLNKHRPISVYIITIAFISSKQSGIYGNPELAAMDI
jgi:hypothetical protein